MYAIEDTGALVLDVAFTFVHDCAIGKELSSACAPKPLEDGREVFNSGDCIDDITTGFRGASAGIDGAIVDVETGFDEAELLEGPRTGDDGEAGHKRVRKTKMQTMRKQWGEPAARQARGGIVEMWIPPEGVWNVDPKVGADGEDAATNFIMSVMQRANCYKNIGREDTNNNAPDASTGKVDDTVAFPDPKTRSSRRRFRAPIEDRSSLDFVEEETASDLELAPTWVLTIGDLAVGDVLGSLDDADADWSYVRTNGVFESPISQLTVTKKKS